MDGGLGEGGLSEPQEGKPSRRAERLGPSTCSSQEPGFLGRCHTPGEGGFPQTQCCPSALSTSLLILSHLSPPLRPPAWGLLVPLWLCTFLPSPPVWTLWV